MYGMALLLNVFGWVSNFRKLQNKKDSIKNKLSELQDKKDSITNTIVDFARHVSVYVFRSCLKIRDNPETRSQFYKDERPYEVFENVNYECDQNNFVTEKVARNQKKFVCDNMGNNILAVQGVCVFSEDGRCYTDIAGEVQYDENIFPEVLCHNVTFDCWIAFDFVRSADVVQSEPKINKITYKLHSLLRVCPDRFVFANNAPWARKSRPMYDENDPFLASVEPQKIYNFTGINAYVLRGEDIYVPSKPRCQVSLAWNQMNSLVRTDETKMQPHLPILVDLRFNDILNRYIVYDAARRPGPMLPAELTTELSHRVSLTPVLNCPGYFKFGRDGLVFDKYGQLVSFYGKNDGPKVTADIGYVDPDDRAYTTIEVHQLHDEVPELNFKKEKSVGIYIGNNEFFCPRLHFYILRAPHGLQFTVGAWYDIFLEDIDEANCIADVEAFLRTDLAHVPFKKISNGCYEFLLEANIIKILEVEMLLSNDIGPIGMTDADFLKYEKMGACGVQFPKPQQNPIHRPQTRPIFMKQYKNVQQGKAMGRYM